VCRGTVAEVRCSDIGEGTGIFGQIARLDVTVDGDDGSAPASLIAKMACIEPANLEIAQMLGLYEREINMFEHVLDDTPIRTPVCHAAVRSDDGRFLLLLEDLSVDYEVGDQIVGATLEQAARRWQRPIRRGSSTTSSTSMPAPYSESLVVDVRTDDGPGRDGAGEDRGG
jgi:hypothetical protein